MAEAPSNLQAAWVEACAQFKAATGFDIAQSARTESLSGDDVVDKFNAKKAQAAKARQKSDHVKAVVGETIRIIEGAGKVAAQGAALVFGSPATIAMGCISALIDAGFEYKNIATNIEDLFGRMASIMERFQIYHNNERVMDPAMIRIATRLLIAVVNICKLCIVMIHRHPFGKFVDVALFSRDGGVKAQFGVLEELQKEESRMKGTLTYVVAENTKRDIAAGFEQIKESELKIADSISQLNANSSEEKVLRFLKEKLGGGDDSSSKGAFKAIQDQFSSTTCSWIRDDAQYQSWSDSRPAADSPILLVQGDEGCGKTWAFTAIVKDLLKRYPQARQDANRVSVAYYYPTQISKKDGKTGAVSKLGPSVAGMLRDWAWQAINNDLFYRKAIDTMLKEDPDIGGGDLMDTWEKLFLSHIKRENCVFFLLLDGVQELESKELDRLSALIKRLSAMGTDKTAGSIKILLASRSPYVRSLTSQTGVNATVLNLRSKSRDDVGVYIKERADSLTIFQKKDSSRITELKNQVCQGLLDAVDGDFILAAKKLEEISDSHDPEEVMKIVQRTKEGAGMNASILDDIRHCNRTLSRWDMLNLNTMLLWIMHGEWGFQIWELDSILFIQQERESLQPLYNDIKSKFSAFFRMDDVQEERNTTVYLKYDSIEEHFRNLSSNAGLPDVPSPQTLTEGEIRTVQHFISKLCEPDMYKKLGLEEFFDQKLSQSNTGVSVDCDNAHAIIANDCLRTLLGEVGDEADGLVPYASYYLGVHLKKIDLDSVTPSRKAELGPRLVKAFKTKDTVAKFHKTDRSSWSFKDDALSQVVRLLRSSAVTKRVNDPEDREWIQTVLDDPTPELVLLKEAAKRSAELWLGEESSYDVMIQFQWLFGFYNKISAMENKDVVRLEASSDEKAEKDEIEEIYEIAQNLVPDNTTPSPLLLRNLGVTFRENQHFTEAIEYFHKALEADPQNIMASASLAQAYSREVADSSSSDWKPDWEKALHHAETVIKALQDGKRMFTFEEPEVTLRGMLIDKAKWVRKLGRHAESRKIYTDLIAQEPENHELRLGLVQVLCDTGCHHEVVDMLRVLSETLDEETQQTQASKFFHAHENDEDCHVTIFRAFLHVDDVGTIKGHYQRAVDDLKKDKTFTEWRSKYTSGFLQYYLAAMLYRHSTSAGEKEDAVHMWEHVAAMKSSGGILYPQILAARRLARIYVSRATEAGRDSPVSREMLAKIQTFTSSTKAASGSGTDGKEDSDGDDDDDDMSLGLSHAEVRSLLGRYYSAVGDVEQAKKHLRPGIELGVKLLSDDDPENDYQAYRKLGDALMDYGDFVNAIAAWTLIQPTKGMELHRKTSINVSDAAPGTEDAAANSDTDSLTVSRRTAPAGGFFRSRPGTEVGFKSDAGDEDSDASSVTGTNTTAAAVSGTRGTSPAPRPAHPFSLRRAPTSRRLEGPLGYQCDGRCGKQWTYADDFYVCRECIDVQFDAPCLEKLRQGGIHRDICDPKHTFMHVPAWSLESYTRAQDQKVLVGDKELGWQDWLDGIKREWGLMEGEGQAKVVEVGGKGENGSVVTGSTLVATVA